MNIKKAFLSVTAVIALSAVLTGCSGSLKTARVAAKLGAALKDQPITSATAEISSGISVKSDETTVVSKFRTVVKSKTDWDLNRSYSEISSSFSLNNQDLSQNMQCYTSGESGEDVRYLHLDKGDTWLRLQNQMRVVDVDPALILLLLDKVSNETTLEERETTVGGGIHYVLGLTFQAQDLWDFAETAGVKIPEEFNDCDLKGVTMPLELEIEDKTFLPIRLQVRLQGINDSLITALAKASAKGKAAENLDIHMDEISLLITNFSYGPQDIPMLPKGAAENALDMEKVKEIQN